MLRIFLLLAIMTTCESGVAEGGGTTTGNPRSIVDIGVPTSIPGIRALPAPPANFDALTAPQEELAKYGIASRPDKSGSQNDLILWKSLYLKPRIFPELRLNKDVFHGPARIKSIGAASVDSVRNSTSDNWSGFVITDPSNPFKGRSAYLFGSFIEPKFQSGCSPNGPGSYQSSQWVGFDGIKTNDVQSNDVVQAGTEMVVQCSGWGTTHYAWLEWFPNPEISITNLPVNQGDTVSITISLPQDVPRPPGVPPEPVSISLCTSSCVFLSITQPAGVQFVGNSVEWIVERPTVGNSLAALPGYGDMAWLNSGAFYYTVSGQPGVVTKPSEYNSSATLNVLSMIDGNGAIVSSPRLFPGSPGKFDDVFLFTSAYQK